MYIYTIIDLFLFFLLCIVLEYSKLNNNEYFFLPISSIHVHVLLHFHLTFSCKFFSSNNTFIFVDTKLFLFILVINVLNLLTNPSTFSQKKNPTKSRLIEREDTILMYKHWRNNRWNITKFVNRVFKVTGSNGFRPFFGSHKSGFRNKPNSA